MIMLSLMWAVHAEPVTVSLGVQNVAPTMSGLTGTRSGSLLTVTFLLKDSNTIADIQSVTVVIWHRESTTLMQRFTWDGMGFAWNPQPIKADVPSPEMRRSKGFNFSLTIMLHEVVDGMVLVSATDSGGERAYSTCVIRS